MHTAFCSTNAITQPAKAFRLLPAGLFRASDGRPRGLRGWIMDGIAARQIIAAAAAAKNDMLIDYEHQSLASDNKAAPAAGWFKSLEWREGDGLYVTDARWTDRAAALLTTREYRYISPVFSFDIVSGRVLALVSAAITNKPALDGLTDLAAATRQTQVAPAGVSAEDYAKLKQAFGDDFMDRAAEMEAFEAACAIPPEGISVHEHAKMQAVFGMDYAIRSGASGGE